MKATGIVRSIDCMGRFVLPMELRRTMNLEAKDALEVFVQDTDIVLRKYDPNCIFCGSQERLVELKGRRICVNCAQELRRVN